MDFTGAIESAEKQFKQILEEYFISVYNEESLSSHGIDHHRRVWNYSKEILKLITLKDNTRISQLPEQLIIACYLHDIGMTVDPGIKHGKHSRNLCLQFLKNNNLPENDFRNVLETIENHDNKDYTGNTDSNDLLIILSVSDDLDAFGCIGIYRYIEIYLTRKIEPERLGFLVRENAEKRFDNFIKTFGSVNELVVKHWERYYLLNMFFTKYNEQLLSYHFGTAHPSGFCGVIEIFIYMLKNKIELKEIYLDTEKYLVDPAILWFFTELEKELSGL